MITINCPNCGKRNSSEFRFGGEYNLRPAQPLEQSDAQWADYIYMQNNKLGVQKEWWYHRHGCSTWFVAERHTGSNGIERTTFWEPSK